MFFFPGWWYCWLLVLLCDILYNSDWLFSPVILANHQWSRCARNGRLCAGGWLQPDVLKRLPEAVMLAELLLTATRQCVLTSYSMAWWWWDGLWWMPSLNSMLLLPPDRWWWPTFIDYLPPTDDTDIWWYCSWYIGNSCRHSTATWWQYWTLPILMSVFFASLPYQYVLFLRRWYYSNYYWWRKSGEGNTLYYYWKIIDDVGERRKEGVSLLPTCCPHLLKWLTFFTEEVLMITIRCLTCSDDLDRKFSLLTPTILNLRMMENGRPLWWRLLFLLVCVLVTLLMMMFHYWSGRVDLFPITNFLVITVHILPNYTVLTFDIIPPSLLLFTMPLVWPLWWFFLLPTLYSEGFYYVVPSSVFLFIDDCYRLVGLVLVHYCLVGRLCSYAILPPVDSIPWYGSLLFLCLSPPSPVVADQAVVALCVTGKNCCWWYHHNASVITIWFIHPTTHTCNDLPTSSDSPILWPCSESGSDDYRPRDFGGDATDEFILLLCVTFWF